MLEKIKQVLSHQRNFGIHTPFMILHQLDGLVHVLPHTITGNRKAAALGQINVLEEFANYEEQIRKLTTFAYGIKYRIASK